MKTLLAALAATAAMACATAPRSSAEIESARAAYRAAAASAAVQERARVELELAERALSDAERLHLAEVEPVRVAHFAYVAEQKARIASKVAELRAVDFKEAER